MARLAAKRKQPRRSKSAGTRGGTPRSSIKLRTVPGSNAWQFVHPRCVKQRAEDIEEVLVMLDAGEYEIAIDELRWLLDGCPDFILVHKMLGEIALAEGDVPLARGHFGYAYQIGRRALPDGGLRGTLPHGLLPNQAFHEAGKGLAWCLIELGEHALARQVIDELLGLDPTDPLGVSKLAAQQAPDPLP